MKSAALLLVPAVLAALSTPAQASIFDNPTRWPAGPQLYTIIPVCVIDGSSADTKGYGADVGLIHDTNPSLAAVINHVRKALAESWEFYGNVRFTGWQSCGSLSLSAQQSTVGMYIHPNAGDESLIGIGARGATTLANPGVQFKPFGPSFAKCVKYNFSSTHVEYTFDCAEQYAVHEFGHAIGFLHEWGNPVRPAGCSVSDRLLTPADYATLFDPNKEVTLVNPFNYDWDSIMTYNSDCAHVSGVRFGSTRLSSWDIVGVQTIYPAIWPGIHDVGVLAGSAGCGSNDTLYIRMDTEDNNGATSGSGWRGGTAISASAINFEFCRIDGDQLGKLNTPGTSGDYIVLMLGPACPSGSVEFLRYFDNEDNDNQNYIAGNANPNRQNFGGGTGTELHFCLFRSSNPGNHIISNFPVYPFEYGVFAASDFARNLATGSIHTDDEDSNNSNSWTYYDPTSASEVSRIMFGGPNTDMSVTQVMSAGVAFTANVQPAGAGIVTPPSGLLPAGASVQAMAHPNPGYQFSSWSGPVSPLTANPASVSMTGPVTLTANFNLLSTSLTTNLIAKGGPTNSRVWTLNIVNSGPGATPGLAVKTFQLSQVGGNPCTPVVKDSLPLAVPDIAPGASGLAAVTIDFSSCEALARFTLDYMVGTPNGAFASRTLYNQFR